MKLILLWDKSVFRDTLSWCFLFSVSPASQEDECETRERGYDITLLKGGWYDPFQYCNTHEEYCSPTLCNNVPPRYYNQFWRQASKQASGQSNIIWSSKKIWSFKIGFKMHYKGLIWHLKHLIPQRNRNFEAFHSYKNREKSGKIGKSWKQFHKRHITISFKSE